MHRLFFALSPPSDVRAQLERAARAVTATAGAGGRVTAPGQLHLTLAFLGDFDDEEAVARALAAGEAARGTPFTLQFDHAASFGPTWFLGPSAPPQPLLDLHAALSSALAQTGFEPERRAFHPHVTFQRHAGHALPPTPIPPIPWHSHEFVLFDSRPAQNFYSHLAEWRL